MSNRVFPSSMRRVSLTISLALSVLWLLSGVLTFTQAVQAQPNIPTRRLTADTVITVTNASDDGPGSLRQAIAGAANGDLITFDSDYAIYLNSKLEITRQVTIDGGNNVITVSGDSLNDGSRNVEVFYIDSTGVVTLNHLSIVSGMDTFGGGLYIVAGGRVSVQSGIFADNRAFNGGAIYNEGLLMLTSSTLVSNTSLGNGGAIVNEDTGTVILSNSLVIRNSAPFYGNGGGIASNGMLTIMNSTLVSNTASGSGGGIFVTGDGHLILQDSTLSENIADVDGGGLLNGYSMLMTNTTVSGNIARRSGGGIYNYAWLTSTNSTFSGNLAQGNDEQYDGGGAIDQWGQLPGGIPLPNATFVNVTFADNDAPNVAKRDGLWLERGNLTLQNVLLVHNGAANCTIETTNTTFTATADSLAEDTTCAGATSVPSTSLILTPLANNGGSTWTQALLPGSPAIDAGNDATCPPTDQRGIARPQGAHCDIGAYESSGDTTTSLTQHIYIPTIIR